MKPKARVVLVNAWHDDNKGDSAITEGSLQLIRHAFAAHNVEVDCTVVGLNEAGRLAENATRHISASWPEVATIPTPIPTQQRRGHDVRPIVDVPIWLVRLLPSVVASFTGRVPRRLRPVLDGADLVVSMGGANLNDDASVNAIASLARLYTLVAPLRAAVRLQQPVLLLGHTLGPFPERRRVATAMARRMIGGVNLAIVREAESIPIAEHLGIARVELAPDMAFALVPQATDRVRKILAASAVPADRTAVVAVRSHPSLGPEADARMISEVTNALGLLHERGLCDGALVIPHTIGPTPIEDDTKASRALAESLEREIPAFPTALLSEDFTPAELAWLYGQMACMIAVRLHAAILAMISGTPTFAISYYTHKTRGVMNGVGLGEFVGDFATVTGEEIARVLEARIGSPIHREALASVCLGNRRQLETRCRSWIAECLRLDNVREPASRDQTWTE